MAVKELKIDLMPLIHRLDAVLKKGFSRDILAGNYQSVYRGKGMEFVGFREYSPDDDALLIDWKASLRAHKSIVRVFQEERDLNVIFLLDVSDSMLFGSHSKLKCEYAAELVGTLCYAMQQVGDKIGLIMFTDRVMDIKPPALGTHQFYNIARALSNPKNYGGKKDFNSVLNYFMNLAFIKRDSIVFIVSDFIGLRPGWERLVKLIGLKYDLTAVIIRDPVDMRLPEVEGEVHLVDASKEDEMLINPIEIKKQYEINTKRQVDHVKEELNKTRSSTILLETDKEFNQAIFSFFKRRKGGH